ncbi:MAG: hypothetical protein JRI23_06955, partial [Deltaproteobacteria bacterium]|nr:hypothetical protein [Deltaproteobacteria bacterium]MBW2531326.1 hypothetical protein [Deltaproteobacteria bacterium]
GDHERPSSIRSDVPAVVDAWFTRAFARDKESRFPSAKELAVAFMSLIPATEQRALDAWPAALVGGQSDPRLGADTFTPTRVPRRRWTAPALGGALIGIALASAAALLMLRAGDDPGSSSSAAPAQTQTATPDRDGSDRSPDEAAEGAGGAARPSASTTASASSQPKPYWRPRPRSDAIELRPKPTPVEPAPPSTPATPPTRGEEDYGF